MLLVLEKMGITTVMRFCGRKEMFLEFAQEKATRDGYLVKIPSSSWLGLLKNYPWVVASMDNKKVKIKK